VSNECGRVAKGFEKVLQTRSESLEKRRQPAHKAPQDLPVGGGFRIVENLFETSGQRPG
jgi:hypothetical protein